MANQKRDIFICHASEDKEEIVRPVVEAFSQAGISCWYDEAEIKWGDSITQKVNEGLRISQYVIVVLSSAFLAKKWPQRELNAALNLEASTGDVKVLPLLVGTESEKAAIIAKLPLLNDKRYLPWDGDRKKIVTAMQKRLGSELGSNDTKSSQGRASTLKIPIPKIGKTFSQRDRDLFLRNAFIVVKQYFRTALVELERHYQEAETDFMEVHNFKFLCTIYIRGEVANRCKIWLGGLASSDSIAYYDGQSSIDSDNSINDMLSVGDNEQVLGFKPSSFGFGRQEYSERDILTAEQAAEYFWRRLTDRLG
ncbi:MAG: toll/interleukin-1 receptor domain-containing protein [Deltaproteobacteria bacterium]|nr:toll/interleukin-1 receptor domain-containing protein [Deltaproteobacteria bacterium]